MLLAVDAALGEHVDATVLALRRAFAPALLPFAAPAMPPDEGLAAALATASTVVLLAAQPTSWLRDFDAKAVVLGPNDDAVARVAEATGLRPNPPAARKPVRLPPLAAGRLAAGVVGLGDAWSIEVAAGNGIGGLKVELVAQFRSDGYGAAADFAHAVAVLAETQNHHPTLIHDWRTVTVRVATGEAGQRLTERDLRFAAAVDRLAGGGGR